MNVTMVVFSQTGNTRRVAATMAEAFGEAGHAVRIVPLKEATAQDAAACDLFGIGTPCFSSQAPTPVKRFLRALPVLNKRKAFVFATSGGAPGRVLYDLAAPLREKEMNVVGGFLTRGELHHPAPSLTGRMPGRPNEEDLADARQFAAALCAHVASGEPVPVTGSRPDMLKPGWGFYDMAAMLSTDGFLRLVLPEPRHDPARCNQCGWCASECPVDNITMVPYPVLGNQCIRCYRCLTGCPQKAFVADWRLGNLAVLTFYNTLFERWFGDLEPGETIYAGN